MEDGLDDLGFFDQNLGEVDEVFAEFVNELDEFGWSPFADVGPVYVDDGAATPVAGGLATPICPASPLSPGHAPSPSVSVGDPPPVSVDEEEPPPLAPPPLPPPAPEAPDPVGRGWGVRAVNAHEFAIVPRRNDPLQVAGKIVINSHHLSMSLDAHCDACKCKVNRRHIARAGGGTHHQGRPLGSLLAWLELDCGGDKELHRALYSNLNLPHATRVAARQWAMGLGTMGPLFVKERFQRADEPVEPVPLA